MVPTLCWAPVQPRGWGWGRRGCCLAPPPLSRFQRPLPTPHRFPLLRPQGLPVLSACLNSFPISFATSCSRCLARSCPRKLRQAGTKQRASGFAPWSRGRTAAQPATRAMCRGSPRRGSRHFPELGYDPDITGNRFTLKNSLSLI